MTNSSNSGPLVNSEYYPGWLDFWGQRHNTEKSSKVAKSFDDYLSYQNASVSVYVAHGGTSFGFETGMVSRFQLSFHPYYINLFVQYVRTVIN